METTRASARLRKAFRYPEDEDHSLEPDAMDEEEQEQLIQDLQKQNDASNEIWLKSLLALTGFCFLAFFPFIFQASSRSVMLMCILALTSTAMTAYTLLFIPTGGPKLAIFPRSDLSPAQRLIPYMNGVLALLIGLNGLNWRDRFGAPDGFWIASWLPFIIFATIITARRVLVEVNPEELWNLKYELRGA